VLKIHVIRQGGHHYYVDDLVPGRAEGTLVAGESPGAWTGTGATALGVADAVEATSFGEVLEGRHPRWGTSLRAIRGDRSVAGFDLTFCAPKSVSILHLLAPGEIAGQVGDGHHAAVAEATEYLQRAAVRVRRTCHGRLALMSSTGMVAGNFVHRTSRALDPHLHSHLVVANVAEGVDGMWSTVDSRRIFAHLGAAGAIYHARLRWELSERIGAAWEVPANGLGDVVGVERRMRRLFSQRSATVDEYVMGRAVGTGGPTRTRVAFHATRPEKDRSQTVESLANQWRRRAADFGYDLGDLTRAVGRRRQVATVPEIDRGRVHERLQHLAGHQRSLAQRDVVGVLAGASSGGTRAQVVESVAAHILERSGEELDPSGTRTPGGGPGRGAEVREPRRSAADLARFVEGQPEELASFAQLDGWRTAREGPGIGRHHGLGRDGWQGRDGVAARSLADERADDRVLGDGQLGR
jgi:conjugative relaxase-like TrwC/TraI family protein